MSLEKEYLPTHLKETINFSLESVKREGTKRWLLYHPEYQTALRGAAGKTGMDQPFCRKSWPWSSGKTQTVSVLTWTGEPYELWPDGRPGFTFYQGSGHIQGKRNAGGDTPGGSSPSHAPIAHEGPRAGTWGHPAALPPATQPQANQPEEEKGHRRLNSLVT